MKKLQLFIVIFTINLFTFNFCFAQDENKNHIIQIVTQTQISPAALIFTWPAIAKGTQISIFRKAKADTEWDLNQPLATLAGNATKFTDNTVVLGQDYEYFFRGFGEDANPFVYLYGGVNVTQVDNRGKLILLIEDTYKTSLNTEINRLVLDITGDGWQVIKHYVSRANRAPAVKNIIKTEYNADPQNVKAVFILGNIRVPYTGDIAWDGHPDHNGAWPCDGYYADMTGTWTDDKVSTTQAWRTQNQNIIGDGKFDQNYFPAATTLQIGRVDLSKMPEFKTTDEILLRRYLDKNHNFRHKNFTAQPRALIDNSFGINGYDASYYASCGWRSFITMFPFANTTDSDYFQSSKTESYLWAYAAGGGTFTSAQGVGNTNYFTAVNGPKIVFNMLFGSYFGDWDSENNFLRAPLASTGWGLASCWAGRPYWMLHHTALGETIGYSALITMRNTCYQSGGPYLNQTSINLMGDPTLRIHPVAPATNLLLNNNTLTWQPSAENIEGYCVYRKNIETGIYNKIATTASNQTNYQDNNPNAGDNFYMVRALKLENTNSGSYFNLSQGVFVSTQNPLPLVLTQFTAKLNANTVVNNWQTQNEVNVNYLNLQRSTDAKNFISLTKVNAKGGGNYSFTDTNLPNNVNNLYYRLQIVDNDKFEQFSEIKTVNLALSTQPSLSIYPNPIATGTPFSVKLNNLPKGNYSISILNTAGKNLYQTSFYYNGLDLTKYITANFTSGVYILNISSPNYKETKQFLVQ